MNTALAILAHALRMLIFETGTTLKVILPALIIVFGSAIAVSVLAPEAIVDLQIRQDATALPSASEMLLVLGIGTVGLLGYALMAILWHRHVLRFDAGGVQTAFPDTSIFFSYIGRAIYVGIVQIVASIPITLGMATLGPVLVSVMGGLGVLVVGALGGLALVWVAMRISLVLPAAAVGTRLTVRQSWEATAAMSGAIWGIAALLVGLNMLIVGLLGNLLPSSGGAALIAHTFIYVVEGIVFVSVLTTLYGNLIEGRSLG